MEITLNLAWLMCSVCLFWYWMRNRAANLNPRRMQVFALAMVVLLLLPVISMSDDLVAMQSPAETDMCLRRASDKDGIHPSLIPAPVAMIEAAFSGPVMLMIAQEMPRSVGLAPLPHSFSPSRFSRPPPQA